MSAGCVAGCSEWRTHWSRLQWRPVILWLTVNPQYDHRDVQRFNRSFQRAQVKRRPYFQYRGGYYNPRKLNDLYAWLDFERIMQQLRARLGY